MYARRLTAAFCLALALAVSAGLTACKDADKSPAAPPPPVVAPTPPSPPMPSFNRVPRSDFNRAAVRLDLPLYWVSDANKNATIDPDEIVTLLYYPTTPMWVEGGKFTPAFSSAYDRVVASASAGQTSLGNDEEKRRSLVLADLDQGRPTLVLTDLGKWSVEERALIAAIVDLSADVHALYLKQGGVDALAGEVPADDAASQSLFRRNSGPRCVAPRTEKEKLCSAIPGSPKAVVSVYPARLQADPKFCTTLEARKDANALLGPFTVVVDAGGKTDKLIAQPYNAAYKPEMDAIATKLDGAAKLAAALPDEAAFTAYLIAAAAAFRSNDWLAADEAWAKMSATNSKFYLRIAPDETYWEPCSHKAGFHVSFAAINRASLTWQEKLTPVLGEMEAHLARFAGAPYVARKVTFHLPDFIDIIETAGDSRSPLGATIGQSLPNWGKVADESRGRTVAMSNLYTDPDSLAARRAQAASLLDSASMASYVDDAEPGLLSTILHEAAHNLGPSHDYKAGGKTDDQAFGGPLASLFEELKAQTAGLMLVSFLVDKHLLTDEQARRVYTDSLVWAFGHIAEGMTTADGGRKTYSQLAAIQIGAFMDAGALVWDPRAKSAGGDTGAFHVDMAKLPAAYDALGKIVLGVKARNDKKGALALVEKYVDGKVVPMDVIAERWLRAPRVSFVYGFRAAPTKP